MKFSVLRMINGIIRDAAAADNVPVVNQLILLFRITKNIWWSYFR